MRKLLYIFITLFCQLSFLICAAQTDYVLTTKGDTIVGKIKYLNNGLEKRVQVAQANGSKITYTITQTFAFKLGSDLYQPVRYNDVYTYMKVLKAGYLSYYSFQLPNQVTWEGRYLLKKDGKGIEVPNIGFKKILNQFLSECPDVTSKITSGDLPKNKINEIVDLYNSCIDSNTKKQLPEKSVESLTAIQAWNTLEDEIKKLDSFEQKENALEMLTEIKSKINRGEKIPKFLTEGLTSALKDQLSIKETLDKALAELKNSEYPQ